MSILEISIKGHIIAIWHGIMEGGVGGCKRPAGRTDVEAAHKGLRGGARVRDDEEVVDEAQHERVARRGGGLPVCTRFRDSTCA